VINAYLSFCLLPSAFCLQECEADL